MISRCPREIAAPIDEDIVVAERHVARGRWTTAQLPFSIVGRRRVQRGVQHYDTTVADLQSNRRKKKENQLSKFMERAILRGDFRRPSFQRILSSRFLFHWNIFSSATKYPFSLGNWIKKNCLKPGLAKVDFCSRANRAHVASASVAICTRTRRVPKTYPRCSLEIKNWRKCLSEYPCIWRDAVENLELL